MGARENLQRLYDKKTQENRIWSIRSSAQESTCRRFRTPSGPAARRLLTATALELRRQTRTSAREHD